MSSQQPTIGTALERVKFYATIMVVALLVPLLISFMIYLVGSAFASGGGLAPGITYGLYAITSSTSGASSYTIPSGVAYLWINSPANGGIASSPSFPIVMITILNDLIVVISILVAVFAGFELVSSLLTHIGGRY